MRGQKLKVAIMAAILVVLVTPIYCQLNRKYVRFKHKGANYHAAFAAACEVMLANYPLGTNKFLQLSTTDAFVPPIIRDLQPARIKIATNWVWVLVDGSHTDGLAVVWELQWNPNGEREINTWNLRIGTGEGENEVVYISRH